MLNHDYIKTIMKSIRSSIKQHYGEISPSYEPMLTFYEDALGRYIDMQEAYDNGNHSAALLKSIKDTMAVIMTISSKLGVSSPLDLAKLKRAESKSEEDNEEKDYLDTLEC